MLKPVQGSEPSPGRIPVVGEGGQLNTLQETEHIVPELMPWLTSHGLQMSIRLCGTEATGCATGIVDAVGGTEPACRGGVARPVDM
eukprot:2378776-Rhodomonas_salina.1